MKKLSQALQILGSILSTKMSGNPLRQIRIAGVLLLLLFVLSSYLQQQGAQH